MSVEKIPVVILNGFLGSGKTTLFNLIAGNLKSSKGEVIFNNENIDIDLDLFRDIPINLNFHSIRWYSHLTGTSLDMNRNYLEVGTNREFNDKIVIVRTQRYLSLIHI